jgi:glycosyltransferase involved in cell wall biosynthesis
MKRAKSEPQVMVVQATARLHYGAATAFHHHAALKALVTDLYIPHQIRWMVNKVPAIQRYCIALPSTLIHCTNVLGIAYRLDIRRRSTFSFEPHVWISRRLATDAARIAQNVSFNTVYGFDTQSLEIFQAMKGAGKRLLLEQCVAPRRSQRKVINKLSEWIEPTTLSRRLKTLDVLERREREEWRLADQIICPSNYVKRELVSAGVEDEKISVVPYGFTPPKADRKPRMTRRAGLLKGLFVGSVDYRKGIQDIAKIAPEFAGAIEFEAIGKSLMDRTAVSNLGRSIRLRGKLPFSEVLIAMEKADFLILPSYLEGSATVVYEALSMGLPSIVTHETGSVITDGIEGFLFDAGDLFGLRNILRRVIANPTMLDAMSNAARETARSYTAVEYGKRLWVATCGW